MTSRSICLRRASLRTDLSFSLLFSVAFFLLAGCSKKEPEIAPEVSVQVAPAKTGDVSRIVTAPDLGPSS